MSLTYNSWIISSSDHSPMLTKSSYKNSIMSEHIQYNFCCNGQAVSYIQNFVYFYISTDRHIEAYIYENLHKFILPATHLPVSDAFNIYVYRLPSSHAS